MPNVVIAERLGIGDSDVDSQKARSTAKTSCAIAIFAHFLRLDQKK